MTLTLYSNVVHFIPLQTGTQKEDKISNQYQKVLYNKIYNQDFLKKLVTVDAFHFHDIKQLL